MSTCTCERCVKTDDIVGLLTFTIGRKQSHHDKLVRQVDDSTSEGHKVMIEMLRLNIEELKKIRNDLK
jgi:hypothetical protein